MLAGCTGGLSDNQKIAAENISASLEQEYGDISVGQADCAAKGMVKDIGLDHLQAAKLLGDNLTVLSNVRDATLSEADAKKAAHAFDGCGDFQQVVARMVTDLFKSDDTQSSCIDDKVTEAATDAWVTSDLSGKVTDNIYVVAGRACMSTPERDAKAVAALTKNLHGASKGLTAVQATCVAKGLVEQIGTHELVAAEILTPQLTIPATVGGTPMNATDANLAADATAACVPADVMLTQNNTATQTPTVTAVMACLRDLLDPATYHAYLVGSYMGAQGLPQASINKLAGCLKPLLEKAKKHKRR
jgi:hypothetical protein